MRIRATCASCGKDFYFLQLYQAAAEDSDRCPNCSASLGIVNLRQSTLAADTALAELTSVLHAIAQRSPGFFVDEASVVAPIVNALQRDDGPPTSDGSERARHRRRRLAPRVLP